MSLGDNNNMCCFFIIDPNSPYFNPVVFNNEFDRYTNGLLEDAVYYADNGQLDKMNGILCCVDFLERMYRSVLNEEHIDPKILEDLSFQTNDISKYGYKEATKKELKNALCASLRGDIRNFEKSINNAINYSDVLGDERIIGSCDFIMEIGYTALIKNIWIWQGRILIYILPNPLICIS